jgi:hypothetical protein
MNLLRDLIAVLGRIATVLEQFYQLIAEEVMREWVREIDQEQAPQNHPVLPPF